MRPKRYPAQQLQINGVQHGYAAIEAHVDATSLIVNPNVVSVRPHFDARVGSKGQPRISVQMTIPTRCNIESLCTRRVCDTLRLLEAGDALCHRMRTHIDNIDRVVSKLRDEEMPLLQI